MGKLWRIDGQSPNSPMFSPANVLRYTVVALPYLQLLTHYTTQPTQPLWVESVGIKKTTSKTKSIQIACKITYEIITI